MRIPRVRAPILIHRAVERTRTPRRAVTEHRTIQRFVRHSPGSRQILCTGAGTRPVYSRVHHRPIVNGRIHCWRLRGSGPVLQLRIATDRRGADRRTGTDDPRGGPASRVAAGSATPAALGGRPVSGRIERDRQRPGAQPGSRGGVAAARLRGCALSHLGAGEPRPTLARASSASSPRSRSTCAMTSPCSRLRTGRRRAALTLRVDYVASAAAGTAARVRSLLVRVATEHVTPGAAATALTLTARDAAARAGSAPPPAAFLDVPITVRLTDADRARPGGAVFPVETLQNELLRAALNAVRAAGDAGLTPGGPTLSDAALTSLDDTIAGPTISNGPTGRHRARAPPTTAPTSSSIWSGCASSRAQGRRAPRRHRTRERAFHFRAPPRRVKRWPRFGGRRAARRRAVAVGEQPARRHDSTRDRLLESVAALAQERDIKLIDRRSIPMAPSPSRRSTSTWSRRSAPGPTCRRRSTPSGSYRQRHLHEHNLLRPPAAQRAGGHRPPRERRAAGPGARPRSQRLPRTRDHARRELWIHGLHLLRATRTSASETC